MTTKDRLLDTNSISLHRLSDPIAIADMKAAYLASLSTPMDGMWSAGFIDPGPHWEIREAGAPVGYFATNGTDTLWQFYVSPVHRGRARDLFAHILNESRVTKAFVATIDPVLLSLCLDVHSSLKVHTFLYELVAVAPPDRERRAEFRLVRPDELERVVPFQRVSLAAGPELEEWLRGYSTNLIERSELYVLEGIDEWIGLGELRRSDSQPGVADVGMMVHSNHRGEGWAGHILQLLCEQCREEGSVAICSTTTENVAAQRAIERAGFRSRHRILEVLL